MSVAYWHGVAFGYLRHDGGVRTSRSVIIGRYGRPFRVIPYTNGTNDRFIRSSLPFGNDSEAVTCCALLRPRPPDAVLFGQTESRSVGSSWGNVSGVFWKRKERAAEKAARDTQEFQHKADAWRDYIELCSQRVEIARAFEGVQGTEANGCSILLKAGERMFCTVNGAVLVEPRRTKGHWTRANQGPSVQMPETRSTRYRVGPTRGAYVQGFEIPARIDDGAFTVTNQRGVFIGKKATREWQWAMLLGVLHATDAPWTAIAVSDRKWVSGIACDNEHIDQLRFWIDFAVAVANGTRVAFVRELEEHLAGQRAIAAGVPADDGFHADAKELLAASSRRTQQEPEMSSAETAIPRAVLTRVLQELGFPDATTTGEGFAMSNVDELFDGTRLKVYWHGDRETNIPAIAKALRVAGYAARVVRDRGGYPYVSVRNS